MKTSRIMVLVLAGLLVAALAVAGCGGKKETTTPGTTPEEVGNVTGESITTRAAEDFQVSLAENPSTGYSWSVTTAPDKAIVVQKGESLFVPAPGSSGMVGAGGTEIWTFTAEAPGSTTIVFENRAPGAKDTDAPAWTHTVAVKVVQKPSTPVPEPRTYTDPNTPIEETVGREFHINMSEQTASTGYKWLLDSGYNHSVCVFEGVRFLSAGTEMGAPQVEVWRFMTRGAGTTKLKFSYVRPFDKEGTPAKTATFTVNVS